MGGWLVQGAAPGDALFFHYSGHGGQEADPTMMEEDGMNETLIPVDYQQAGQIIDDVVHQMLVKPLPAGVRLTAIFDSCHSGTVMDLPFVYHDTESAEYKHAHKSDDSGFSKRHKISELGTILTGGLGGLAKVAGGELLYQGKKHGRRNIMEK